MKKSPHKTIGILIIVFWASFIPYLYPTPFQPHPKVEELAESLVNVPQHLKKYGELENKTKEDIVRGIMRSVLIHWSKLFTLIFVGILAGISILKSYKKTVLPGALFYAALSAYYVWQRFQFGSTDRIINTYKVMLKGAPVRFVQYEILYPTLCIFLAIYFLKYLVQHSYFEDKCIEYNAQARRASTPV